MTERQFHDTILQENTMPVEIIRALMTGENLGSDFSSRWRFYEQENREE